MRRVLVTGAAGFLGINLVRELRERDVEVVAVDDGSAGTWQRLEEFADDSGVTACRADICDRQALAAAWPEDGVWGVVHLAAKHFIPDCQAHPEQTWRTNVTGTANVLAVSARKPPARFLLASTADVYSPGEGPHREDDEIAPESVYGRTKQLDEAMVGHAAAMREDTAFLTVRLFNLYGPGATVDHLIPVISRQALAGDRLALGNLDSFRDYVFVADVAAALVDLLEGEATGVVNIGTGIGTDGHRLVAKTGQAMGRSLAVECDPARLRPSDRMRLVADPERLISLVPWWPATTLDEGLGAVLRAEAR
jgi:UDP-glucose 4-epimerase